MKKAGVTIVCILLAVGLFALARGNIFTLMLAALFLPMIFVYQRALSSVTLSVLSVLVFGVACFLLAGLNVAGVLMCCILPSALITGHALERKTAFYDSVLASAVTMLASVGVLFLCVYLLYGVSFFDLVLQKTEAWLNANPEMTKQLYYMTNQMQQNTQQTALLEADSATALADMLLAQRAAVESVPFTTALKGVMRLFSQGMTLYLAQAAAFCVPMFGLLNYLIPRAVYKKRGRAVRALPAFSSWGLPKRFGTWSLILLLLAYIGMYGGWRNFEYVYIISFGFLNAVYSVHGMAFLDWLLKKKIAQGAGRAAIIAAVFIVGFLWNITMWIGFFEQIVKLRKRESIANESNRP
ncbi:MAG TPA: hypothetical protein DEB31_02865 [Clostridiales bacterium]|nr:hypothetical protein [Clostridiales bacterium]